MKQIFKLTLILSVILTASGCKKDENNEKKKPDLVTETGSTVHVLDTKTKVESITPNGITFKNWGGEQQPQKGDIIVSAPAENVPFGFLYKIKTISSSDGMISITTEPASIEEAVQNASVHETINLNDYIIGIVDAEGKEIPMARNMLKAGGSVESGVKIEINASMPLGGENLKAKLEGEAELKLIADFDLEIEEGNLQRMKFTVSPEFMTKITLGFEGKIKAEKTITIAQVKLSPIVIQAGFVPIVFVPVVSLDVEIGIEGTAKLAANLVDINYKYIYGMEYKDGILSKIEQNDSKPVKILEDVQLLLSGEAKVEPQLSLKFKLYDQEAYIGVFGGYPTKLSVEDITLNLNVVYGLEEFNPKMKLTTGITLGLEAKLEIFSKKLLEFKPSFNAVTWNIWERKVFPEFDEITFDNQTSSSITSRSVIKGFEFIFSVEQYGFCWGLAPKPAVTGNKNEFGSLASGKYDLPVLYNISSLQGNRTYYIRPYFKNMFGIFYGKEIGFSLDEDPDDPNDPNGVVINGVRWATRNVAAPGAFAAKPEDPGMFYQWNRKTAWPATGNVTGWGWDSSPSTGTAWEKSNDPCPAGWRMPTAVEQQNLFNAGSMWTNINGVYGRQFGSGSNTIFLPAVGARIYSDGMFVNEGSNGYYWSSTQNNATYAYCLSFSSVTAGVSYNNLRAYGFSCRCVADN
jgi:uncharacterized protein (TIGR02145 family)